MGYRIGEDGKLYTPGGCRPDNGRTFARIGFDIVCEATAVEFHDGSIYRTPPRVGRAAWEALTNRFDPGCVWNGWMTALRGQNWVKGDIPFWDWTAEPLYYEPRATPRPNVEDYFKPCPMQDDEPRL